jgi:hypothetical protein
MGDVLRRLVKNPRGGIDDDIDKLSDDVIIVLVQFLADFLRAIAAFHRKTNPALGFCSF